MEEKAWPATQPTWLPDHVEVAIKTQLQWLQHKNYNQVVRKSVLDRPVGFVIQYLLKKLNRTGW